MYKANTVEPQELTAKLERRFHRKAKYEAARRQARQVKYALSDIRGSSMDALYEELPSYR